MQAEKKNFLVTQSNRLIEANYSANLTTLAHKVAKLIMGFVNPEEDYNNISITVDISKLKQYLGWSQGKKWNRFYSDLKDISKRLNKEPIEIVGEDEILVAYFLSSYKLNLKRGEITFNISPELVPHLTQLKRNFTTYQLKYIPKLTSAYAIRMYELFYQYLKIGNRRFTVDDFKKKVGAPQSYKYNDLKKRVIIPAQTQLKENTNLAFIYNEIKAGRSIAELEFVIFGNTPPQDDPQIELDFLTDPIEKEDKINPVFSEKIINALKRMGISEQNIAKYLAQGFDIIQDKSKRVVAKERCKTLENYYLEKLTLAERSKNKNNAAGFIIKALREDWVSDKTFREIKSREAIKKRKKKEREVKVLQDRLEKLAKKRDLVKAPIIEGLMIDDAVANSVYETVMGEMGSLLKKHLSEVSTLPIREQYEGSIFLKNGMNLELAERFPEKFSEVQVIQEQIDQIENNIKSLKKCK
ncbi:MAG: replication initiation protein [Bacteroidota bacterium]